MINEHDFVETDIGPFINNYFASFAK